MPVSVTVFALLLAGIFDWFVYLSDKLQQGELLFRNKIIYQKSSRLSPSIMGFNGYCFNKIKFLQPPLILKHVQILFM
jgi:hypothetical protein